jgi:hypothetical protein
MAKIASATTCTLGLYLYRLWEGGAYNTNSIRGNLIQYCGRFLKAHYFMQRNALHFTFFAIPSLLQKFLQFKV